MTFRISKEECSHIHYFYSILKMVTKLKQETQYSSAGLAKNVGFINL